LPLHCKDVACAVSYDAVRSLSSSDPRRVESFEHWVGYATDPARYDGVPVVTTVQRATRFADAEEFAELLESAGTDNVNPRQRAWEERVERSDFGDRRKEGFRGGSRGGRGGGSRGGSRGGSAQGGRVCVKSRSSGRVGHPPLGG
jgi:hypothetical protein